IHRLFKQTPNSITIKNDDDLCLFLSELDNEKNTKHELIKYVLKQEPMEQDESSEYYPKANLLCNKFRYYFLNSDDINPMNYINSILTSFVKQSPSNFEGALDYLARLQEQTSTNSKILDGAIRYLNYFIDIDRLYNIALGTYNFNLVLMISEKTQKDPKEYLQYLNELKQIQSESWRRFRIDCHLKRFKKAIENGCDHFVSITDEENDKFQEFLSILEKNRLYKVAIRRFLTNKDIVLTSIYVNEVIKLYGNYLMTKKYYIEAGLVFERGNLTKQALNAYEQGKDTENYLKLVERMKHEHNSSEPSDQLQNISPIIIVQQQQHYRSMAETLCNDSSYLDSGRIYEYYIGDYEEAFLSYLKGHEWSHVLRLFEVEQLRKRQDLYDNEFLTTFVDYYEQILRQIKNDQEKFFLYFKRLLTIRENLFQHIKQLLDNGKDFDIDDDDENEDEREDDMNIDRRTVNKDETGSIRTRLSKKSTASTSKKSQRRLNQQEQKLVTLKENSKHEDLALIKELWLLSTRVDQLNKDIKHVCKTLYQITTKKKILDYELKAEHLQINYEKSMNGIEKCLSKIWLNEQTNTSTLTKVDNMNVQTNLIQKKIKEKLKKDLDLLSNQYRILPTVTKATVWKLICLEMDV
ncbi:unnamed protein product, partial [Didymodactylos carnosus]